MSRDLVHHRPFFISIAGGPGSGKSCCLASMIWETRHIASSFNVLFRDALVAANRELISYEETLFAAVDKDHPVAIRKTETHGLQLHHEVMLNGGQRLLPQPFQILTGLAPDHADHTSEDSRVMVLYDNAGEHFLPGQESAAAPVTQHLGASNAILFVFDPTQETRFVEKTGKRYDELPGSLRITAAGARQESVLSEMAERVRRFRNLPGTQRVSTPLLVLLAKADLWQELIGDPLVEEPLWRVGADASLLVDIGRIRGVSRGCRDLLMESCPGIVSAAEGFSERVTYVPVSALGCGPEKSETEQGATWGVLPRKVSPKWMSVPMLLLLASVFKRKIATLR